MYAMLGNGETVAWLTPHAAVARGSKRMLDCWEQLNNSCRFRISTDNGNDMYALARSPEHLLEICDVLLRLLAASVVHSVVLNEWGSPRDGALINSASLAHLMEQCQSLKLLSFEATNLDEHHCRVLGVYSRPGLEIELKECTITGSGARALVEVLGRNQGPTKLYRCFIDNLVLTDGLRGNSRLKSFRQHFFDNSSVSNREFVAIAGALRENKGLVRLELRYYKSIMNDESWGAICASLKMHPTLEVLYLIRIGEQTMPPDVITSRMQALLDMIKVNTSIRTINVNLCYEEHELYRGSVIPYLETNRLWPRLLATQKVRPIVYRTKVLGRALLATRTDANQVWMLYQGIRKLRFRRERRRSRRLRTFLRLLPLILH
jgi:hypothetical protein